MGRIVLVAAGVLIACLLLFSSRISRDSHPVADEPTHPVSSAREEPASPRKDLDPGAPETGAALSGAETDGRQPTLPGLRDWREVEVLKRKGPQLTDPSQMDSRVRALFDEMEAVGGMDLETDIENLNALGEADLEEGLLNLRETLANQDDAALAGILEDLDRFLQSKRIEEGEPVLETLPEVQEAPDGQGAETAPRAPAERPSPSPDIR